MNLNALGKLCTEAKALYLYDAADGTQWAGTSAAIWQLPKQLGRITADMLCAIWDISPEKTALMSITEGDFPEAYDTDPYSAGEKDMLWWIRRRLVLDGDDLLPLRAPNGEIYTIKTKYIKPGKDAEQPALCLRQTAEGAPYIVCKDGMWVTAVIMPRQPSPEQVTWLGEVCRGITVE